MKKEKLKNTCIYRVIFLNQGQKEIYTVYAQSVSQSEMYGFIEIGELVWGKSSDIVVDPTEERLRNEFKEVENTFIPIYSVIRVDKVKKAGEMKISTTQSHNSNIMPFPASTILHLDKK